MEKKLVNLLIACLAVACLVFLLFGDYLKLSGYLVSIICVIMPGYLRANWQRFNNVFSAPLVARVQLILASASFLNVLGSLDFYHVNQMTLWYDSIVHFINPLLFFSLTPILPILWQKVLFKKNNLILTVALNFCLAIFFSFTWEFYESLVDAVFTSATMFGQGGEFLYDTLTDLSADFFGLIGATFLLYNNLYGYLLKNLSFNVKIQPVI